MLTDNRNSTVFLLSLLFSLLFYYLFLFVCIFFVLVVFVALDWFNQGYNSKTYRVVKSTFKRRTLYNCFDFEVPSALPVHVCWLKFISCILCVLDHLITDKHKKCLFSGRREHRSKSA